MIFVDSNGCEKSLYPTEEWRSVAGYWVDDNGNLFNFPDSIATKGGLIKIDLAKHKALALFALNYAKQRREQRLNALQVEIERLEKAIASLR